MAFLATLHQQVVLGCARRESVTHLGDGLLDLDDLASASATDPTGRGLLAAALRAEESGGTDDSSSGQVSTVALLGNNVGDGTGSTTSAALLEGGDVDGLLDGGRGLLGILGGNNDTLSRLGGLNADSLGINKTRVLVAVELDEVTGLAGEDAADTLLLDDEAGVVADKKPLEVLGSHFE